MNQRVLRSVDAEIVAAARERWVVPVEGFLWRSRRCAEAMLYALLVEATVDVAQLAEQGKSLDSLLKHTGLQGQIPRAMRVHLESVQKYGNAATHYQPDGLASEANATIVGSALSEIVRWFYTRGDKPLPDDMRAPLAALTEERKRLRSSTELALEQAQRNVQDLTRTLGAATIPLATPPPPAFNAKLAAVGVVLLATGLALGFGLGRGPAASAEATPVAPSVPTDPWTAPPAPTPPAPAPPAPTPPAPVVAEVAPPAPTVSRCPLSMALVGTPGTPSAFCIDEAPVTTGHYRRCVQRGVCERPPTGRGEGCNWQNGLNELAANCLPWSLARAYCQQQAGGDLPTRGEWASAAQVASVRYAGGTREWNLEPPNEGTAWVRGGQTRPRWTRMSKQFGHRTVGFRCVVHATTAP